jgi:hypothetical protein
LVFITDIKSVYWAVGIGSLNKAVCFSSLEGYVAGHRTNLPILTGSFESLPARCWEQQLICEKGATYGRKIPLKLEIIY